MEKIVLEVDDKIAKLWRNISVEKKKVLANQINIILAEQLFEYDESSFRQYLDQLRDAMKERGLTQQALNDILKDEL
jgi:outer membrane protein TolC